MDLKTKAACLLEERCRQAAGELERSVAAWGEAIRAQVEFAVQAGLLPMEEALAAVRRGLGEALHAYPHAFVWVTDEFQQKVRRVIQDSFGKDPWYPYSPEIVQHDDPHDRAQAWCQAQGRLLVIAGASYDRMQSTAPQRRPRTKDEHLKRLIAAAKEQVRFAAALDLIPPDDALEAVLRGVDQAFRRAGELRLIPDDGEQRRRLREMIAAGIAG